MRRMTFGLVTAALILAISAPGSAGTATRREETKPYNAVSAGVEGSEGTLGEVTFETRRNERFIRLVVSDATGRDIAFDIDQGDADSIEVDGCGTSPRIPITGGEPVTVSLLLHFEGDGCDTSTATQGTVAATFTGAR